MSPQLLVLALVASLIVACSSSDTSPMPNAGMGAGTGGSGGGGAGAAASGGAGASGGGTGAGTGAMGGAPDDEQSEACRDEARSCGSFGGRACDTVLCPELVACRQGAECRGTCEADCYPLSYCGPACSEEPTPELTELCAARDIASCGSSDDDGGASLCRVVPPLGERCPSINPAYEELLSCSAAMPCDSSSASAIEGQRGAVTKAELECVFSKLAAREPGRYVHHTSHAFSNGTGRIVHNFIVEADGSVLYGSSGTSGFAEPTDSVFRCELQPAAYYEDCLSKLEADASGNGDAWLCAYGSSSIDVAPVMPWVAGCSLIGVLTCP